MPFILQERVSLKSFNTFGVAAQARWLARVESVEDLQGLLADPRVRDLPRLILGGGSNVLFAGDFDGLVLQPFARGVEDLGECEGCRLIRVAAGEPWAAVVEQLVGSGIPGVENLALIPGLTGAAPIQNIGAYGLELAERLHAVHVWDPASGGLRDLAVEQCDLGYRDSRFKRQLRDAGAGADAAPIVLAITLRLPRPWVPVTGYAELARELDERACGRPTAGDIFDAVCALRRRKLPDPLLLGNAGSFFKNPIIDREQHTGLIERFPSMVSYPLAGGRYKIGAAWMIEACQLKGMTRSRAGVYEAQALVLVNRGGASGRDILPLAREVQERVHARFGILLEPEVQIVGDGAQELSTALGSS
jgi:UDP-N-acetylmuramate dehydrogenase